MRFFLALAALCPLAISLQAHFPFAVPQKDGTLKVVFSETLEVDDAVTVEKLAALKLTLLSGGKKADLPLKAGEHDLAGKPGDKPELAFGSVPYGVMTRGDSKPFLLQYHLKTVWPEAKETKLGKEAPLEIVPTMKDGKITLTVLSRGEPVSNAEVNLIREDGKKEKFKTGNDGATPAIEAAGWYGAWVRKFEEKAGEHESKKYGEIRHYATLVAHAK